MLRSMYDYVIVDVDKRLGDLALSILDHADEVHIVMTADLSCLKNVRLVLEALRKVGFDPKRLKLVLNRSNAFTGISVVGAPRAPSSASSRRRSRTSTGSRSRPRTRARRSRYSKPDSPLSKEIVELAQAIDASSRRRSRPSAGAAGAACGSRSGRA